MLNARIRSHQFYHLTTGISNKYKFIYLTELTLNFVIGFYLCYTQHRFALFFIILIPFLIYLIILFYTLNPFQMFTKTSISDSFKISNSTKKTDQQFYRMIPNGYYTFSDALTSTLAMGILYTLLACILNIIMVQNNTWTIIYILLYGSFVPISFFSLYLNMKGRINTLFVINYLYVTWIIVIFGLLNESNFIFDLNMIWVMIVLLLYSIISFLCVFKIKKHVKAGWLK